MPLQLCVNWRSSYIFFEQGKFYSKQVCGWRVMRFFRFQPLLRQQRQHQISILFFKLKITSHLVEFYEHGSFDSFHFNK